MLLVQLGLIVLVMFGNLPNWTRPGARPILAKFPNITRTINP